MAIARGDCTAAIVGGCNLIVAPALTMASSEHGVLSPDGSCKTFSADANGYARSEAVSAIFIKPLSSALKDGDPIRCVIRGTAINSDGKTNGISLPNPRAQEALIRHTYKLAGISEFSKTAFVECHGTGTAAGDPLEADAIASIFGKSGLDPHSRIHITSVKPNLGHSEGASGLTSLIKAVLALEHRTIPPNIKSQPLNPRIPFEGAGLEVPLEPTPWPADKDDRVSVNAFGIGGANAHVILESVGDLRLRSRMANLERESKPQLLVFSANSLDSLKKMGERYQEFLETTSECLEDIAYTLGNKREHLPYRSFFVATSGCQISPITLPAASSKQSQTPSLVMVFTGQGAQWPQMGRELLTSNAAFSDSIRLLDESLEALGAEWNIRTEINRPVSKSRINDAEFSQPLCTALQIALVDTLASIGIRPMAVVGHSSGEIAAAYAAGGLSLGEAIAAAYYRGVVAKNQTKPGAMAAVGLGWDEAEKHLIPGVVVACDNSPKGVTLSGDVEPMNRVLEHIRADNPGILATSLKVQKAYHSHHMAEIGHAYFQAMSGIVMGQSPSLPFFSTVTGKLLGESQDGMSFGPEYWQANLEHPVLFRNAVSSILEDPAFNNPVFLEIGPHSALSGPLRQILSHEGNTAPYVSMMTRRQNAAEGLLSALGKLYALHIEADFEVLMSTGRCISGLPHYPWNHKHSYWWEPRVAKEWRHRKYPYHDLLGVKIPESTDIEPVFRNLFHLENAAWMRDHKIRSDVIFPLAGYVAMTGEAIRQLTGVDDGFSLRRVRIETALVVAEGAPTEIVSTFRRHRLTDSTESQWWEFVITSHNGHGWMKHCSGQVRAESATTMKPAVLPSDLPRKVGMKKWYDMLRKVGIDYGPEFRSLEQVTASTTLPRICVATTRNTRHGDGQKYHLHPVVVDAYFQLLGAAGKSGLTNEVRQLVPTKVASLKIFRSDAAEFKATAHAEYDADEVVGEGSFVADSQAVLQIFGAYLSPLDDLEANPSTYFPPTARCEWVRHIDFENPNSLVKPAHDFSQYEHQLTELSQLAITLSQRSAAAVSIGTQDPHLQNYRAWLDQQDVAQVENGDQSIIKNRIDGLVDSLAGSSAAPVATAIAKVATESSLILSGATNAQDMLAVTDILDKLQEFMVEYDASILLRCMGNSKPNLRVLELGGGHGNSTTTNLKSLTRGSTPLFSLYVFSDTSAGRVGAVKEHFQGFPNLDFATLDLGRSPVDQGFQHDNFDLIIASGLIHKTSKISRTLSNLRKILSPNGRLLLQEPKPDLVWLKYVLGTLPNWWACAEDDRSEGPHISDNRWGEELKQAGFGYAILDSNPSQINTVVLAKVQDEKLPAKQVTLVSGSASDTSARRMALALESRGYQISYGSFTDNPPLTGNVIVLEDTTPFFENIQNSDFENLKSYVQKLGSTGLLWVTPVSSTHHCFDPRYAQTLGFARTIRSELGVDFATCEIDNLASPELIADVYNRFNRRQDDGILSPDMEYVICDGSIRVSRFFPFSMEREALISHPSDEARLMIARPGRIESLHWIATSQLTLQDDEIELEVHSVGLNFRVSLS